MKKILLVEDYEEVRHWLSELIHIAFGDDIQLTAVATVKEAMDTIENNTFDLAVIDYNLPDGEGPEIILKIKTTAPDTYCVVATIFDDDEHIINALKVGAQGYLLKDQDNNELLNNLRGILKDEPPLSPPIARRIIQQFQNPDPIYIEDDEENARLSKRETEILTLVAQGLNRTEISELLHLSVHTVSSHIKSIYRKLDISTKPEATMKAIRMGLVKP